MATNKDYIQHGIKWGLIMGGITAAIRNSVWLINPEKAMDGSGNGGIMYWVTIALFFGGLAYIATKARAITGFITFKAAFLTLFMAILVHGATNFVVSGTLTVINQEKIVELMDQKREEMIIEFEEKGMSDEQIENSMMWMDMFKNPVLGLTVWFFVTLALNTIVVLIVAAIVKKEPPAPLQVEHKATE